MTNIKPDGPYVYQPFGSVDHPAHAKAGRLWGVSGVSPYTTIVGLTRAEATQVADLLRALSKIKAMP